MLAAVRNFVIVFLISAAVFGSIAFIITGFISEQLVGIAEESDTGGDDFVPVVPDIPVISPGGDPAPSYPDLDGESFTALLIGTDYRPDDFIDYAEDLSRGTFNNGTLGVLTRPIRRKCADLIMLVTVCEESRRIVFSVIPSDTEVKIGDNYRLLGECYDRYGTETIVDFVDYLTATPVDYYFRLNVTDAGYVLDVIDGVDIDVPADIINPYYNPDRTEENAPFSGIDGERDFDTYLSIEAGANHIDSSNLFALLHYRTEAPEALSTRGDTMLALARAALARVVSAEYIARAPELFADVVRYTETNMNADGLAEALGLLRHYDEFEVSVLTYPGSVSTLDGRECFIPNVNEAYSLFRAIRNNA